MPQKAELVELGYAPELAAKAEAFRKQNGSTPEARGEQNHA
jgi:hypothetical protein